MESRLSCEYHILPRNWALPFSPGFPSFSVIAVSHNTEPHPCLSVIILNSQRQTNNWKPIVTAVHQSLLNTWISKLKNQYTWETAKLKDVGEQSENIHPGLQHQSLSPIALNEAQLRSPWWIEGWTETEQASTQRHHAPYPRRLCHALAKAGYANQRLASGLLNTLLVAGWFSPSPSFFLDLFST